jgi:hypothetical protein
MSTRQRASESPLVAVCDQRGDLLLRQTGPERDSANPNPNPRAQPVLRRVVGYVEDLLAKSEIAAYPPRAHEILTKVGVGGTPDRREFFI